MLRTTGAQPSLCAQVLFTADTAGTETGVINNSNDDSGPLRSSVPVRGMHSTRRLKPQQLSGTPAIIVL